MRNAGMNNLFFFDTYALFEIVRGSSAYLRYAEALAATTIFNLAELNCGLKKEIDGHTADSLTEKFSLYLVKVTVQDVQKAMSLKLKQKELSIPDAIGYVVAQRLGVRFLTGDKDFKNLPEVEFVKK